MNISGLFEEINEILEFLTVGWFKEILRRRRNSKRIEKMKADDALHDAEEYRLYVKYWRRLYKDKK